MRNMAWRKWREKPPSRAKSMRMEMLDVPALLYVGSSIVSAVVIVTTLKADIRWIKHWMEEHAENDRANFADIRDRLNRS